PREPASESAWYFAFVQGELLLPESDVAAMLPLAGGALSARAESRHYLGTLASVDCWARTLAEAPTGWRRTPLRAAMMALDPALSALAGRAAQVLEWDRT